MDFDKTTQRVTESINAYYASFSLPAPKIENLYFTENAFTKRVKGAVKEIKKTSTSFVLHSYPNIPSFAFDLRKVLQEAFGFTVKSVEIFYTGNYKVMVEAE